MPFFDWLEHSALSMWIKESESLWPYDIFCLSAHAVGMALLVGFSTAVALRALGVAPDVRPAAMGRFMPVVYAGFWINALSGTGLFITYPVKAVTNPIFYLKILGVVAAIVCIRRMAAALFAADAGADEAQRLERARRPAMTLLIVWVVTITAGRLLAYKGIPAIEWVAAIGMTALTAIAGAVVYIKTRSRVSEARATAPLSVSQH